HQTPKRGEQTEIGSQSNLQRSGGSEDLRRGGARGRRDGPGRDGRLHGQRRAQGPRFRHHRERHGPRGAGHRPAPGQPGPGQRRSRGAGHHPAPGQPGPVQGRAARLGAERDRDQVR
ncbi:MAG: hypothetical protein E6I36_11055, partial [Chloroflexi bacterium]